MKRPMLAAGISFLLAQLAANAAGAVVAAVLCGLAIIGTITSCILLDKEHREMVLPVLIPCVLAFGIFSGYSFIKVIPAQMLAGRTLEISGTVREQTVEEFDRFYYVVDTVSVSVPDAPQKIRMRLSSPIPLEADVGDYVTAMVRINQPEEKLKFSVKFSRLAKGILLTSYIPSQTETEVRDERRGVLYNVQQLRNRITAKIYGLLDDEGASMLLGMLLGNKSEMSSELQANFRVCGLSHLLAVSGLHMSIIVYAVTMLMYRVGINYRAAAAVDIVVVVFYAMLTGFSFSVLRAGLMYCYILTERIIRREPDSLSAFGSALLVICAINPFAATDAGLLLSASTTLGLLVFNDPLRKRIKTMIGKTGLKRVRILNSAAESVAVSVIASVCTVPVAALYFGECSLIAPLSNLLCIALANGFLVSGGIAVTLAFIPFVGRFLSVAVSSITWLTGRLLLAIIGTLSGIPNAAINVNYSFAGVFFLCAAAMLLFWYFAYGRGKRRAAGFAVCAAVLCQSLLFGIAAEKIICSFDNSVTVYSAGNGLGVVAHSGDDCVVIGSGGDGQQLWQMTTDMQDKGQKHADAVFYPESGEACASYAEEFLSCNKPKRIFAGEDSEKSALFAAMAEKYGAELYDVSDAYFEMKNGKLAVDTFTDTNGMVWTYVISGRICVLICPQYGDCLLLPERMKAPDCAVVQGDRIVNLHAVSANAVIISAEADECAKAAAILRYNGAENVFCTDSGNLVISEYGSGIRVGDR